MPTKAKNGKALLIVESPSKVKTISGYLGNDFWWIRPWDIFVTYRSLPNCPKPEKGPGRQVRGQYRRRF